MRQRLGLWVFLLLAALLCLLGVMQYRWISRLAAAETDREKQALRSAVSQFTAAFDAEVTRAQLAFAPFPMMRGVEDWADRFQNWQEFAPYPRLIKQVILTEADRTFLLTPTGLTPVAQSINTGDNPVATMPLRSVREERPEGPPGEMRGSGYFRRFDGSGPGFRPGPRPDVEGGRPAEPPAAAANRLVVFDRAYIEAELIPKLADRYLPADRFGVRVSTGDAQLFTRGEFVASSTARVFSFRPECFGMNSGPRGDRRRRGFGGGWNGGPNLFSRTDVACPDLPPDTPESGRWIVEAGLIAPGGGFHEFRTRSLLVSFGVLGVLGAGIAMLGIYGHRAQVLAQRQMEFAMAVSHELRTPLTVIRVAADNLAEGLVAQPEKYGDMIRREAIRLTDMVEQVLVFARTQRADIQPQFEPVRPADVIDRAITASASSLATAGLVVERDAPEDLPAIRGDVNLISAGLQNLLVNAAKYARSGGVVRVRASHADNEVRIAVEDDGPGVRSSDLSRIFSPFYRSADAANSSVPGLGLGLHLVKRIVDAHGGVIKASNGEGKGFQIEMRLPAFE